MSGQELLRKEMEGERQLSPYFSAFVVMLATTHESLGLVL